MASATRLTVVISQGQSKHPAKQELEENIAAALLMEPGIELSVVPHLYDLSEGHTGLMFLRSIRSDMVVLSWLFPRAAHWVLDRAGVKGKLGDVLLKKPSEEEEEEEADDDEEEAQPKNPIGPVALPDRNLYCFDLRDFNDPNLYVKEIRRLADLAKPKPASGMAVDLSGWLRKAPAPAVAAPVPAGNGHSHSHGHSHEHAHGHSHSHSHDHSHANGNAGANGNGHAEAVKLVPADELLKTPDRRWYPVIDYSRCTNCMECIDFCLFGVYGVDKIDRILVENPDSCRKGCPACSRVCPEHAIIFPQHKTPAIAGDAVAGPGALKIDLSRLFGGPSAVEIAALERDGELVAVGRAAVGLTVGIPKRQEGKAKQPKDDMDKLADALDDLDI